MSATTLKNQSIPYTNQTDHLALPVWRFVIGGLAVITIIGLLVYGIAALNMRTQPFIGALTTQTLTISNARPTVAIDPAGPIDPDDPNIWRALQAGLQAGDQIIALGDTTFSNMSFSEAHTTYYNLLAQSNVGDSLDVTVQRQETAHKNNLTCTGSGVLTCTATITLNGLLPQMDFLFYFVLPLIGAMMIVAMGLAVFRYRSDQISGLIIAAVAFLTAFHMTGNFDNGSFSILTPLWLMMGCWLAGSIITLTLVFPSRLGIVQKQPMLLYVPIVVTTIIGLGLVAQYLNPATPFDTMQPQIVTFVLIICIILSTALVGIQREWAATPIARHQSNIILIGFILMFVPIMLWLLNPFVTIQFEIVTLLFIFPNASLALAILQFRRFDSDAVMSQGITYTIMVGALIFALFLITLGGGLMAMNFLQASDPIVIAFILFAMVAGLVPTRNRIQNRIDAIYYRKKRNYQDRAEEFGRYVTALNDYEQISKQFCNIITDTLESSAVFVFLYQRETGDYRVYTEAGTQTEIRFTPTSTLVEFFSDSANDMVVSLQPGQVWPSELWAERGRLQLLKTMLIAAMLGNEQLNGFIIIAPPDSGGQMYTFEEVRFIENMVSQYAIATERSRAIDVLERRVRELDVLSAVGQAVNFTLEYDDLLELIYAQTNRLVDVPYFYIALYEEKFDTMYFAFFLENEERFNDRENVRWRVDEGLFSQVVSRNTAIRVENYIDEMKKRGIPSTLVTDDMNAWFGVPLAVGRSALGVMAAGKVEPGEDFTDDQFKVFSDIAAIAATSLDKANLFSQTRVRERQLTILNDISRQLVATESDVEKLLKFIMDSAVEILNAEAGSLFLTIEDDSGDLEFRVVIGENSHELVGTRIKADQGIVGRVMNENIPIIANDATRDPRHSQEMVEGFVSRSLLAVPLNAREKTIGVLEILNKRDGTIFVDEDAALLSTFAGQAAIAIENARLLQSTDQQLQQRVRELEMLERIDSRLNRTQDLREVAQITIESTLGVISANAGALGIVHEEERILEIVAIEGYEEEEYPDGANGTLWSLNSGIAARVLRSRQADIAMDVTIDPNYNGNLKGGTSQITLPMLSGEDVIAVLILEKRDQRFSLPEWSLAQRIAEHASIAVANAQLYSGLLQANKSKSQFMGFAAHELKTPLTSVKGYAESILTGMLGELSEPQKNFIGVIQSNANRMTTIINDLRDAAKIDAGEFRVDPEPMDVRNAVIEALRPFSRILEDKDQELVNAVPENLPFVMGDETRLIQVLTNLMSNAHKYSPEETTITVSGEYSENFIDGEGKQHGEMVIVSVIDEGIGMSEDDRQKLFRTQYFRSTNEEAHKQEGTGLGMVLTYNIIKQHKGQIWIESELGKGSTFAFAIPLAPVEEDTEPTEDNPLTEPASD